jgi:hypothetical protein
VAGEGTERAGEVLVFRLEARKPYVSRRREDAFWMKTGDEVTQAAADAGLPFEAVTLFLKKGVNSPGMAVSLYAPKTENGEDRDEGWRVLTKPDRGGKGGSLMEDEKIQFEEAKLIAEEIAKRNRDFLPDEEEEIITPDELEDLIKGE